MDQSSITGLRDTDKYFLMNIDTKIFLNMYQIKNRYLHSLFDEDMFRYRTEKEFPRLMHLKDERSWKRFYFNLVYWANLLKEKYNFESNDFRASPEIYYNMIKKWHDYAYGRARFIKRIYGDMDNKKIIMDNLLYDAAENDYIDLVEYAIKNGAGPEKYQLGMNYAALGGKMESFEFFRRNYVDSKSELSSLREALEWANGGNQEKDNSIMINHIKNLISQINK